MKQYSRINNITGWIVFSLATGLYLYTMEPTVSLWDCGEFSAAAYKLQVGHPPGAPFYLMLARIFALFAPDKSSVAMCINSLSAFASAFTVLFLFWTITRLAKKLFSLEEISDKWNRFKIIGSGVVGSLAFCFSDSFWFSATEAEVYALSSLLTALVFWCVLKWEEDSSNYANRWLILIAYLMGLSIGVHLLNLLAIPAIVVVFYFKKYGSGWKRAGMAMIVSVVLLLVVLYLVIPGTVKLASVVEVIFVNSFHLPINSGLASFVILSVFLLLSFSALAHLKGKVILNHVLLSLAVLVIGYSSYAMIVVRANANPPLNTGNPSHAFTLLSYLNRDQYGDRPLVYGQYFNAPLVKTNTVSVKYSVEGEKYVRKYSQGGYGYDREYKTIFPRMYSANENHIRVYHDWGSIGFKKVKNKDGSYATELNPTFLNNLQFFFSYQVGYMYLRYFMWNFAGKQNDMQGNGGIMKGNWITGFDFIDKWMIGPQEALPDYMKKNPGRNRYFLLPLILGLAGAIFHLTRNRRNFFVVSLLFLLTGLAIVVYTNQTPLQPRERDYVYVGSFYAFCIWIGFGTLWSIHMFQKRFGRNFSAVGGVSVACGIPVLMFFQNYDDHNRHGRVMVHDIAQNYLNSCEPNSILFTVGDNDTYPLWYLQEVEGVRTDVRVINLMLLNTTWYVEQLRQQAYTADPVPWSIPDSFYHSRSWIQVKNNPRPQNLQKAVECLSKEGFIPSRELFLEYQSDTLKFTIPREYLTRNEIVVMDLLSCSDWKRPVYFAAPGHKGTLGLDNYLRLDGFVYRLVPDSSLMQDQFYGSIKSDNLYKTLMETAVWKEWEDGKGFMDDHVRNMLSIMKVRQNYARLAHSLIDEGQPDKALKVLDRVMEIMPPSKIPYDHYCILIAEGYALCNEPDKSNLIVDEYGRYLKQELEFYNKLPHWMKNWVERERSQTVYYLEKLKNVKSLTRE